MTLKNLVLLPGLHGTGELFTDFIPTLPNGLAASVVTYPTERFLAYDELAQLVGISVPQTERFVLLAESFSTPIALKYAASNPPNLAAVVICAGFARNPIGGWARLAKAVAQPWFFTLRAPRFFLEHFLTGENAPSALIQSLRQTLQRVRPEVLSGRVREVLTCDARKDLAQTMVPIMYVRASQDRLLSAACHEEILRIRPDIVFETVDAPHMILQREPQKVAALVAAFIAKCH